MTTTVDMDLKAIQKRLFQANTGYLVKNECLVDLANLLKDLSQASDANSHSDVRSIVKILCDFSHYHDPRVRLTALQSLVTSLNILFVVLTS